VGDRARVGDALDGLDARAVALHGKRQAAAHDHAVEPHGAGAAKAMLAADMAAGEAELLAQEVDERRAGIDALAHLFAVHAERDVVETLGHRGSASCAATRRSSTPARCLFAAADACTSPCGSRS